MVQGGFSPDIALCRTNKKLTVVVPDQAEQSRHRRFAGDCERYFREQRKCSGFALLHF